MKKLSARPLMAALLAVMIGSGPVSPAFAQEPAPYPTQQAPEPHQAPVATTPAAPAIPVSLGVYKHDFSNGPRVFPNFLHAYYPISIEQPTLTNSPRIDQLISDGKLQLTLQDAVELALENNLDIAVQRYVPWIADTDILRAKSGLSPRGVQSQAIAVPASSANLPFFNLDPVILQNVTLDSRSTPINNPFIAGTGTASGATLIGLKSHSTIFNTQYLQSFNTGTSISSSWDNTRSTTSPTANFFNPSVQGALNFGITQQLLNGCCWTVNHRNLIISKNNRKIADLVFTQQAITTVTSTINTYWELVYAREAVKVQQQAATVAEKLYNDNRKQLEIGTMAPLDVTRAESELATDRQNLIAAQTVKLQQEQNLKNAITKDPLAPNVINVEIIPTELPTRPENVEAPTFEEAIKEAFAKRPDVQEQAYNLKNADIDVLATANALRPVLALTANYSSVGLAGNSRRSGTPVVSAGTIPIVDANGNQISVPGPNGTQIPLFQPTVSTPAAGNVFQGFTNTQNEIFHNQFPDYSVGLNLQLPLRNRAAQAENQRAILSQRQLQTQIQQIKNSALLDVRTTYIALGQDRARVEAAIKARELQQQTFDAEQKKYQLGASTVYLVIQTQRDLITAQGTELRALADLVEAKANYERAVGRTLEVNRVTIADAHTGEVERETLIPGTLHGKVVGTEKLFTDSGHK